jgi:hypothetical protein
VGEVTAKRERPCFEDFLAEFGVPEVSGQVWSVTALALAFFDRPTFPRANLLGEGDTARLYLTILPISSPLIPCPCPAEAPARLQ